LQIEIREMPKAVLEQSYACEMFVVEHITGVMESTLLNEPSNYGDASGIS